MRVCLESTGLYELDVALRLQADAGLEIMVAPRPGTRGRGAYLKHRLPILQSGLAADRPPPEPGCFAPRLPITTKSNIQVAAKEPSNVRYDGKEDRSRCALFDFVIGNADRHAGNWMIADGKITLIDHGLCFPEKDFGLTRQAF